MSFFHWNPIRRNLKDVTERKELTNQPIVFIPKHYVHQCKRKLYNNLLILLGGLWALSISHDMDVFETEGKVKLKTVLVSSGLLASDLFAVPLMMGRLGLHSSIVVGAMGMSTTTFLGPTKDPLVLSIVVFSRIIFVALLEVSAMIYIVKLARMSSRIQGNTVSGELLIARSFTTVFRCAARTITFGWRQYTREWGPSEVGTNCGMNYCHLSKPSRKSRLAATLTIGQNTILIAVSIVIALSGVILITMYLRPIRSLADADLSEEPRASNPCRILRQLRRPKVKEIAIMTFARVLMYDLTDEFVLAYATCSSSSEYKFWVTSMREFSMIFGAVGCVTLVDFTGFYWLYATAVGCQWLSYVCIVLWEAEVLASQLFSFAIYHVLCASISVETSILHLLVIQTLGDEEVSAWCLYHVLDDVVWLLLIAFDYFLCTGAKLWILICSSPLAIVTVALYAWRHDETLTSVSLGENCSLRVKTPRRTIDKPIDFDLKIIVEKFDDVRKVETFLERKYTLKSRSLVPPSDAVFSQTLLRVEER